MSEEHFIGKITQKIILEYDGKVLVCRGVGDLVWEFPGGRINTEGSPFENLRREILEEFSIDIGSAKPFHVARSFNLKSGKQQILIAYHALLLKGAFTMKLDELDEAKWISKEELKNLPLFDDCREAASIFLHAINPL